MNLKLIMSRNKKIYHRNDVRPALARLKLASRRLLWLTLAQQEKDSEGVVMFDSNRVYIITAKDYAELCNIDQSGAYKQLKDGIKEIRSHLMEVSENEINPDASTSVSNGRTVIFTVANHGVYSDGDGYVELKFDPIIAPYISNLKSNFTGQFLLSALRLPDTNGNRLYMLLREWVSSGKFVYTDIAVEDLKSKLMIHDVAYYNDFKKFKQSFWQRAVRKVIETTEFTQVEIEIIERTQRKASKVRISYSYDGQKQDFANSGFLLGLEKKAKHASKEKKQINNQDNKITNPDHQPGQATKSADMKQINGKWETRVSAEAAGYIWDDY